MNKGTKHMPRKGSPSDIILDELRILQSEMKANNMILTRVSTTLDSVESQTTKTNGRVSSLESWRNRIVGGMGVISALLGYLMLYLFK